MSMPEVTDEVRDVDDVYVGIVEVDMVDEEIEEKLDTVGGTGEVMEVLDIVGEVIGEKHDGVGVQGVEVEVEVFIEVLDVGELSAVFSTKLHILLISPGGCSENELNPPLFCPYVPHQSWPQPFQSTPLNSLNPPLPPFLPFPFPLIAPDPFPPLNPGAPPQPLPLPKLSLPLPFPFSFPPLPLPLSLLAHSLAKWPYPPHLLQLTSTPSFDVQSPCLCPTPPQP